MRSTLSLLLLLTLSGCASRPGLAGEGSGEERTLRFGSIGVDQSAPLRGTLLTPSRGRDERTPAVVFIHGSGPQPADGPMRGQLLMGFGFTIDVYRELAEGLQAHGIASLRYDKRTCTRGPCDDNGYPAPSAEIRIGDFVLDAQAAVAALRQQPGIDPARTFVVGHSQGGTMVPAILQADPRLAGGAMLATPLRAVDAVLGAQADTARQVLTATGAGAEKTEAVTGPIRRLANSVAALRTAEPTGAQIAGASDHFWLSWTALGDAAPALAAKVPQPLVVVGGNYDFNVMPGELDLWRSALGPRANIHELPCVTHALNCVSERQLRAVRGHHIGNHVDERVVELLVEFVLQQRTPKPDEKTGAGAMR